MFQYLVQTFLIGVEHERSNCLLLLGCLGWYLVNIKYSQLCLVLSGGEKCHGVENMIWWTMYLSVFYCKIYYVNQMKWGDNWWKDGVCDQWIKFGRCLYNNQIALDFELIIISASFGLSNWIQVTSYKCVGLINI